MLLELKGVSKSFFTGTGLFFKKKREVIKANDNISLHINGKETLALVGESGSGKSTLGRIILRLIEPDEGKIFFDGTDITMLKGHELKAIRRKMQIIFQDPLSSLNPRKRVESIIGESLLTHRVFNKKSGEYFDYLKEIMYICGLNISFLKRYPHQASGGQRQRIGIARAIALRPSFIVCDEPVSALDLSIKSQILNLFIDIQERFGVSYLFISHDLSVVKYIAHRIAVIYLGRIVEVADKNSFFKDPLHPYSKLLLASVPDIKRRLSSYDSITKYHRSTIFDRKLTCNGCYFYPRCPVAKNICREIAPKIKSIDNGRMVACHLF